MIFTQEEMKRLGFTRREMLRLGAMAGAAGICRFLVACGDDGGSSDETTADERLPPAPKGICMDPQSELEHAIYALAETIVPGKMTDPQRAPGANACCALNVALDPTLPIVDLSDVVLGMINGVADELYGEKFSGLDYDARVAVAIETERRLPVMTLLYRLIRSAFYGGGYNDIGARWMGFPGENLGYIHHEDFTYGRPVSDEFTKDGNLP